ncbi:MAG: PD-(D/E)XK nuclease family protein, partial [Bacteroidaceae bacterium]|nr:PD-(D/E)XK nuclease family protein [Bacteroidaceae bacterium]
PNNKRISAAIRENINEIYLNRKRDDSKEFNENIKLVEIGIVFFVRNAIKFDLEKLQSLGSNANLVMLEAEKEKLFPPKNNPTEDLQLKIGDQSFNFRMYIDRADCITEDGSEIVRIIDYKTGKDQTVFNFKSIFTIPGENENKAINQLLLYCNAYQQLHPEAKQIRPMIYKLLRISDSGIFYKEPRNNANQIMSFNDSASNHKVDNPNNLPTMNDIYLSHMSKVIKDIFDPEMPFDQCPPKLADKHCKYCGFKALCHRD